MSIVLSTQSNHSITDHTLVRPLISNLTLLKDSFSNKLSDTSPVLDTVKRILVICLSIFTIPIFSLLSIPSLLTHAFDKNLNPLKTTEKTQTLVDPKHIATDDLKLTISEKIEPKDSHLKKGLNVVSGESSSSISQSNNALSKRLQDKKIIVMTTGLGGMGDYMCARKICFYLNETLGVKLENIALGISSLR